MNENTTRVDFQIQGMTCRHCVDTVQGTLNLLDGVRVEEVGIGHARVRYVPTKTTADDLRTALAEAGYPVQSSRALS
jgi:copper chaperone CopZ